MRDDESLILEPATDPSTAPSTALSKVSASASSTAAAPSTAVPDRPPAVSAGSAGLAGPLAEAVPAAWVRRLVLVALVLAAVNLRPAVTSLGALLKDVRDGLGMSGATAGLLTSVPAACFALFGFAAPRLARRRGPGAVVFAGMAAITAGLALRPLAGDAAVFLAISALALAGIAVSNVLMPVVVKRYFPERVGTVTGVYSMALSLGTAVAAAVTVPLADAVGDSWRLGLGVWALPAAVAAACWLPLVRDRSRDGSRDRSRAGSPSAARPPAGPRTDTGPAAPGRAGTPTNTASTADATKAAQGENGRITHSRTAWMLACFFGLQSTAAYVAMGWMPQIFRDAGISADRAGLLLAVTMVMGVPVSFILPPLAARMRSQGPIVVVLAVFQVAGFAGLWAAPAGAPWVWAVLLGLANCAFPLVLTMIGMRSRSGAGVVRLSAFAQSTGYLISIPGPILVGALNQASGGWGVPMALMLALVVPQVACGVLAGRNRHIEDEL